MAVWLNTAFRTFLSPRNILDSFEQDRDARRSLFQPNVVRFQDIS